MCTLKINPNLQTEEIASLGMDTHMCFTHLSYAPVTHPVPITHKCKSHNRDKHDIFLSYRVSTEGGKSHFSTVEQSGGLVEQIYWKLAPQKLQFGAPIVVFWDKMCLNDGCDWEEGFLYGITSATVIVLLLSNQVIEGIHNTATTRQDNVLVEYECALLQYRKCGTPVIPVFVAENIGGKFVEFDFNTITTLPDAPHVRKARASQMIARLSASLAYEQKQFLTSVNKTLAEILQLQGIFMKKRSEDPKEMKELSQRVLDVLSRQKQLMSSSSRNSSSRKSSSVLDVCHCS
eukprot:Phypoly_transcript_08118.p1 GENE.Phypoly_transcript_08118~~Phypoly_transcript_08118.p1  ORF type:complete len:290 (+),score=34.75 Phypoly_transcript_08118:597-1466(+)